VNTFVRLLPIICACVVTQAFAVDPPAKTAEPSQPAGQPADAATAPQSNPPPAKVDSDAPATTGASSATTSANAATAPAKSTRIVLEDKTLTNEEIKQLFSQGYKPVGRGGQVFYCRRQRETGSHFDTMTCKTADQMKQTLQDSKNLLEAAQRPGGCRHEGPAC
jgi:hypothetical protein